MCTVPDFLDETRKEITKRLNELKPLVDEFNRLEAAASALAGAVGSAASEVASAATAAVTRRRKKGPGRPRGSSTSKKGPGRPRGSGARQRATATATSAPKTTSKKVGRSPGTGKKVGRPKGKAGRPKGGGKRAIEALSIVQAQPGITIPELAAKMGIKQNYLYKVLPGLEQEGKLQKKGRGWHSKAA
jgi:hypothetical protein